jgi:hypothetical protein
MQQAKQSSKFVFWLLSGGKLPGQLTSPSVAASRAQAVSSSGHRDLAWLSSVGLVPSSVHNRPHGKATASRLSRARHGSSLGMLSATSTAVPSNLALHNRSFEPTRNGWSLQAPISFWAFRAQPPLAAQLRR